MQQVQFEWRVGYFPKEIKQQREDIHYLQSEKKGEFAVKQEIEQGMAERGMRGRRYKRTNKSWFDERVYDGCPKVK